MNRDAGFVIRRGMMFKKQYIHILKISKKIVSNKIIVVVFFIITLMSSCLQSQSLGPGYEFELFKNTSIWNLAKAVRDEDTSEINKILNNKTVNIDFQEPKFGNTLLLLSVSNGKVLSVKVLLEHGANLDILDSDHMAAIHEATQFIDLRKNVTQILELLLKHGANPNMPANSTMDSSYTPLTGAIENLECTKILLNYGADVYYKTGNEYPVWKSLLILDAPFDENILVAKYLIIDKKIKVPDPIFYTIPDHQPRTILELLNKFKVYDDSKKQKAKAEILDYLKKIDFPKQGAYGEK